MYRAASISLTCNLGKLLIRTPAAFPSLVPWFRKFPSASAVRKVCFHAALVLSSSCACRHALRSSLCQEDFMVQQASVVTARAGEERQWHTCRCLLSVMAAS